MSCEKKFTADSIQDYTQIFKVNNNNRNHIHGHYCEVLSFGWILVHEPRGQLYEEEVPQGWGRGK